VKPDVVTVTLATISNVTGVPTVVENVTGEVSVDPSKE
jgi:hypothetical protein